MQIKAGIAVSILFQSIFATCCIMKKPTTIRAGAVANEGIARKIGEKKRLSRNKPPTTIELRPVRAPSAMPEEDSTKVVMVEVPSTAPTVVPMASARSAPLMRGSLPSLSSISALDAQPIRVPSVSKISTKRKEKTTTRKLTESTLLKSIFIKVGARDAGIAIRDAGIKL